MLDKKKLKIDLFKDTETSLQVFEAILKHVPDYISLIDTDGTFLYVSKTVKGIDEEKIIGSSVYDVVEKKYVDMEKKQIAEALSSGKMQIHKVIGKGPDGKKSMYETRIIPIDYSNNKKLLLFITTDISERERALESLNSRLAELEILNKSFIGRELKMIDLKKEVEELTAKNKKLLEQLKAKAG